MNAPDLRRPLAGRVSFLWAAGVVVLALAALIGGLTAPNVYVPAHWPLLAGAAGVFAVFGLGYFALERRPARRWPADVGRLHAIFTLAGVAVTFAPVFGFARNLHVLSEVAGAGYVLVLLAQMFLVIVLVDAFRPAPEAP